MSYAKKILFSASVLLLGTQAMAQVTFYEGEDFHGRAFTTTRGQVDFKRGGFNDRASSVIVDSGRWEVCEDGGYRGECVLLRPGSYKSLRQMGLNDRVSSARLVADTRGSKYGNYYTPEPLAQAGYEYRRRPNERVYEARVTSVHAVMDTPQQRCWVERERVEGSGRPSVGGGIVGGVIGGILGHQIGSGSGKGIATVGGAAAGAAIGANAGRDRGYSTVERRCETTNSGPPDYWDVTYTYRNVTHHVQMSEPPGRTIYVNRQGEPRQ